MRHPEYYLGRADAMRIVAGHVRDLAVRSELMDFATLYEHMAEEAKRYWGKIDAMLESQCELSQ